MKKFFIPVLFLISFSGICTAQQESFGSQNKNSLYKSFSLGMSASYTYDPSLVEYIRNDIPNYSALPNSRQISDFNTSFGFFGGMEFQLSKSFSLKGEYSFLIKSYDVTQLTAYQYSYTNHQPSLIGYFILPGDYHFLKFGAGAGYVLNSFTRREAGLESKYTSNGALFTAEGILNLQIGKNLGGYLSGKILKTELSDLKNGDEYLLNSAGEKVNASSLGVGIRLGIEIFLF